MAQRETNTDFTSKSRLVKIFKTSLKYSREAQNASNNLKVMYNSSLIPAIITAVIALQMGIFMF